MLYLDKPRISLPITAQYLQSGCVGFRGRAQASLQMYILHVYTMIKRFKIIVPKLPN